MGRTRKNPDDPKWAALDEVKAKEIHPEVIDPETFTAEGYAWPDGAHFSLIQLPRDLSPRPPGLRIVQHVRKNQETRIYITESSYHRTEAKELKQKLEAFAYQSIADGGPTSKPVKWKLHWHYFDSQFVRNPGARLPHVSPEERENDPK